MKKSKVIPPFLIANASGALRKTMSFNIKARLKSFSYASKGIVTLLQTQHNARIHLLATIIAIALGFYFGVSITEWSLLVIAIVLVWLTEALNTAIEFLADTITKDHHPLIGKAKDVAASAVLVASIGALVIGVFIFWPYLGNN